MLPAQLRRTAPPNAFLILGGARPTRVHPSPLSFGGEAARKLGSPTRRSFQSGSSHPSRTEDIKRVRSRSWGDCGNIVRRFRLTTKPLRAQREICPLPHDNPGNRCGSCLDIGEGNVVAVISRHMHEMQGITSFITGNPPPPLGTVISETTLCNFDRENDVSIRAFSWQLSPPSRRPCKGPLPPRRSSVRVSKAAACR